MHFLLTYITRGLSWTVSKLVHIPLPSFLAQRIIACYAKAYSVNLDEVAKPLSSFRSLGAFFVRDLRPGSRSLQFSVRSLISPVDGVLRAVGSVQENDGPTVKGQKFDWQSFLVDEQLRTEFSGGTYFNFYLSPKDYHHVHFPFAGKVVECIHVPGALLPVNDWSVEKFPKLFCVNERVVTVVEAQKFRYLLVMVGALNVGSIGLEFTPGWRRSFFASRPKSIPLPAPVSSAAGDRFGTFYMGSSVVCVFPPNAIETLTSMQNSDVKVGQPLGQV